MSVTSVDKNTETLTLTLIADFDAPVDQVWQLWADPRLLERWWGPPTYPATFEQYEFRPGGKAAYYMTSPEGKQFHGWWEITSIDPPRSLSFADGFADENGERTTDGLPGPMGCTMTLTERDGGTRMEMESRFESVEHLEQMVEMGMMEGLTAAVGQMDELLVAV